MELLIRQIREASASASRSEVIDRSISGWIRYCRDNGISLMGLERLLNFYLSCDPVAVAPERSGLGFVPESEMEISVTDLLRRIEELERENRSLREELNNLKKSGTKKWFK